MVRKMEATVSGANMTELRRKKNMTNATSATMMAASWRANSARIALRISFAGEAPVRLRSRWLCIGLPMLIMLGTAPHNIQDCRTDQDHADYDTLGIGLDIGGGKTNTNDHDENRAQHAADD